MIYDPMNGALYCADGTYLKTLYCPMTIRQADLKQLSPDSPDRHCFTCGETVYSLDEMSDSEAKALIAAKPDACVFATAEAKNVVFLHPIGLKRAARANETIIKTARNLATMNDAQKRGFKLVFMDTGQANKFGQFKFKLYQHAVTGTLEWTGDFRGREMEEGPWNVVREFTFVRLDRPFPLAAYLIPPDLGIGANVFVEDVIQDVGQLQWNQGDSIRIVSDTGVWDGVSIKIKSEMRPSSALVQG